MSAYKESGAAAVGEVALVGEVRSWETGDDKLVVANRAYYDRRRLSRRHDVIGRRPVPDVFPQVCLRLVVGILVADPLDTITVVHRYCRMWLIKKSR